MSKFKDLYNADMARYNGEIEIYMIVFHYLFRKASVTESFPLKYIYKALFRIWANKRGLEMTANMQMGGGIYIGHPYNITINPHAKIGKNCNIHKGIVIGQVNRGVKKGTPVIGDRVWIGINSSIVGNITIGDDVLFCKC